MKRVSRSALSLFVAIVAAACVHCNSSATAANATSNTTASGGSATAAGSAATTNSATSAPWIGREEAERRLRASAMVTEHLRSERATYGDEPEIGVGATPTQGCAANTPACLWIFNTEMRTSSTHAEPLYFAVDPYTGAVSRCTDENCAERSQR